MLLLWLAVLGWNPAKNPTLEFELWDVNIFCKFKQSRSVQFPLKLSEKFRSSHIFNGEKLRIELIKRAQVLSEI